MLNPVGINVFGRIDIVKAEFEFFSQFHYGSIGILFQGSKINGFDVWGREDDIILLTQNGAKTQQNTNEPGEIKNVDHEGIHLSCRLLCKIHSYFYLNSWTKIHTVLSSK